MNFYTGTLLLCITVIILRNSKHNGCFRLNYTLVGWFTPQAQMEALQRSNFKAMKNYVKNNFADCKAVAIISGNIVERDAVVTARNFFSKINMSGNSLHKTILDQVL